MVDGQRDIGHRPDLDRVLAADLADDDALLELADAEDRRLRLVDDDRRGEERARDAVIGDGEGAALDVGARSVSPARAFSISSSRPAAMPFSDSCCTLRSTGTIRPLVPKRGADADIDVVVKLQPVGVPAAVDRRRDLHRLGGGGDQIGGVGELHALLREGRLVRLAMGDDRAEIRLEHGGDVRRLGDRGVHVLGDGEPHPVVRDEVGADVAGWRRG